MSPQDSSSSTTQTTTEETTAEEPATVDLPGFATMPAPRGDDPLDPTATRITSPSDDQDGWDDDEPDEEPSTWTAPRSSPASTPEPVDPLAMRDMLRAAVGIASMGVRFLRRRMIAGLAAARGEVAYDLPAELWVATEEDQAAIGDPLARLAARHAPMGGAASRDVVDVVEALVGTTNYAIRNVHAEAEANYELPPQPAE